ANLEVSTATKARLAGACPIIDPYCIRAYQLINTVLQYTGLS
ncbi:hypothetical protein HMPREF6123_0764, partial [Oribacterium sinus F0268]